MGTSWVFEEDHRALVGHISMEMRVRLAGNLFAGIAAGFGFTDFTRRKDGLEARIGRVSGAYTLTFGYDIFPKVNDGKTSGGLAVTPLARRQGRPRRIPRRPCPSSSGFQSPGGPASPRIAWSSPSKRPSRTDLTA